MDAKCLCVVCCVYPSGSVLFTYIYMPTYMFNVYIHNVQCSHIEYDNKCAEKTLSNRKRKQDSLK